LPYRGSFDCTSSGYSFGSTLSWNLAGVAMGGSLYQRAAGPSVSVRRFSDEDLPQVLDLLEVALGAGPAGGRTPEFFSWKHLDNPFGRSFLLLAEARGRVVGLRAFLRWRLSAGSATFNAVRAVDTATHPAHRGQGLFRRLTLAALDELRGEVDLVFNTPNGKSGPGYLKMGWREVGRVPIALRLRRPLRVLTRWRGVSQPGPPPPVTAPPAASLLERDAQVAALLAHEPAPAGLATVRDPSYLRWRYGAGSPLGYRAVAEERDGQLAGLAVFRVRRRGGLWESTVAEVFAGGDPTVARELLRRVARAAPIDHLTLHAPARSVVARAAARSGFMPSPAGISLVANPLRDDLRPDPSDLGAWALSLGDLEVF
jgi:GNAT superfamily N-acetyltransferase